MAFEYLEPVKSELQDSVYSYPDYTLSKLVTFYNGEQEIDFKKNQLAILGVKDSRNSQYEKKSEECYDEIRIKLYNMFVGNWELNILDLGNIAEGNEVSDTAYVLKTILSNLYRNAVTPIVLGGSQDFTFYQYRAYDSIRYMVNLTTADHKFDLGNSDQPMNGQSYVGKMIVDEPYNLFNYSNLGYQTYLSPQDEIDLMDKLFFEALRLGELKQKFTKVEPVLRDTDIFSIDIFCVKSSEICDPNHKNINGFSTFEFCKLARYAGMSDRLSSLGIYELQSMIASESFTHLISQMLWYFFEGFNLRLNERVNDSNPNFTKYNVPIREEVLVFIKSEISNRWWIKIPNLNNNEHKPSLLACDEQDYLDAIDSKLPNRWLKAKYKDSI